jgi:protein-S-isoprenylcysteine O-methyltransferase Ste14
MLRSGSEMQTASVQLLAVLMTVVNSALWLLVSRWERPGREAQLRATLQPPAPIGRAGDLAQVVPLLYPAVVVVAPGWSYNGRFNWSSGIDLVLQGVGLGLWAAGIIVAFWAARILGRYTSVEGLTVDHQLVTSGPYRHVRHPVYASFSAVALGTSLVFRSYLLVGVAVVWVAASTWWVAAEEKLLASDEGFGDDYRAYSQRTGRVLPRKRRDGDQPGGQHAGKE